MICFISVVEWLLLLSLPGGLALTSQCPLQWQAADQNLPECPFGHAFISVTIPEKGKARLLWNKTHPNGEWIPPYIVAADDADFHRGPFWTSIFVYYGYVPYGVAVLAVLPMLRGRVGTRELSFLLFAALVFFISELVLKNMFCEARPVMSCVTTCGMPSGHSALAMGYWTCMVLDVILRVHAKDSHGQDHVDRLCKAFCYNRCEAICKSIFASKDGFSPFSTQPDVNHVEGVAVVLIWSIILLPVPVSSIGNHDHSPAQVMAGSLVGTICGVLWMGFMRHLQHKCFKWSGRRWGTWIVITHNFVLPAYVAYKKFEDMKKASEALTEEGEARIKLEVYPEQDFNNVELAYYQNTKQLRQDKEDLKLKNARLEELQDLKNKTICKLEAHIETLSEELKTKQAALEAEKRKVKLQATEVRLPAIDSRNFSGTFEDKSLRDPQLRIRLLRRNGDVGYCQTADGYRLYDYQVSGVTTTHVDERGKPVTGKCHGPDTIQWSNGVIYHRVP